MEASIQRAVVRWIRETYGHVKCVATLNENNRHCMDMGCDDGIVDLPIHWTPPGDVMHTLWLELKRCDGSLQENQKEWAADYQENYAARNTYYATAYGFLHAQRIIACIIHECMLKKHY